ncbi:hypothetical protein D0A22_15720 [Stutzerimonas stutzeri]|nr:hypothetical protein D0A22_15720 [Stutzerimonas stutzeri]
MAQPFGGKVERLSTSGSSGGIELDILVGHPEHDLLFIATQVARAAGLKNPSVVVGNFKATKACDMRLSLRDVLLAYSSPVDLPLDPSNRPYQKNTALLNEANTYRMLLKGRAEQSEPFRKWVTEVVLPTIRKTGKFDVNEAQDQTSQDFAGQFEKKHWT